ncbi:glycosyltransferase involved in cell wall biosynthesis [Altererythrobacter atlanticus]|uniref:GDP-mannose-dependent alpha-mannosyltransferase n=1 Tax=Croceibacterium atlanticum TaxID=1267766 RepID=A0A0F7KRY5_9SPHN|nr:glycosyltransferase family 1 protein [Croceibacterium atlanticum]AKH42354.1 GDP-mannose-dependent alpha-mannosyltransferase [Croceibacterium atlanticum]MBB5731131.1 glycosyltransferase involved in cell wall biosynthesis [Croceibacterium atlanticum]
MDIADLRVALFSGNYNYVRDGANQALNRLVDYLLRQGASVRVYSPKVESPAFEPAGELVGLPNLPIPGRGEYRMPLALSAEVKRDLERFRPNVMHVASPDIAGHRAVTWARERGLPVLASVHTRFETYPRYYNMAFLEPVAEAILRRFYNRCDALVAPSQSMVEVLREQGMSDDISLWERGVDREIFNPGRRDTQWRRSHGIADDELAIGFLGRLVMEKGLDVFSATIAELRDRDVKHKVLVIGEGPAHDWFAERLPGAAFVGFQRGADLGRAVASMDVLLNPSVTETFGNVTLEAMACGVPVVAARATGSTSLVSHGKTGVLVEPGQISGFADAIAAYVADPALRAVHGAAGEKRSLDFSWDAINSEVAKAYMRLIEARQSA